MFEVLDNNDFEDRDYGCAYLRISCVCPFLEAM